MDWLRTLARYRGLHRVGIAILLTGVAATMPSLRAVHVQTVDASATHVDVPPWRSPTNSSASRFTAPSAIDLGEDVDQRDRSDRPVTSSRAPARRPGTSSPRVECGSGEGQGRLTFPVVWHRPWLESGP